MRHGRAMVFTFLIAQFFVATLAWAQTEHVIQRGETLYGIARSYKIELSALQAANNITDPSKVRVGQRLVIPTGDETPVPSTAPAVTAYTARAGDTFFSIARQNGMTLDELFALNKLGKNSLLRVGQSVVVAAKSGASPVGQTPTISPSPVPKNPVRVVEGANLRWPHDGERFAVQGKLPGVMIHAKEGDPVVAVSSGRVSYSEPHATLGHVIFIQGNNGYLYIYAGNGETTLKEGDVVNVGDRIGTVGLGPQSTQAQVYFGVWKKGTYINPAQAPRD